MLILSCVLANHMGIISAIEEKIKHELLILNCVKCCSFWAVYIYLLFNNVSIIEAFATAFISSYIAIWLELLFGFIDVCYENIFSKIYKGSTETNNAEANTSDTDAKDSENELP